MSGETIDMGASGFTAVMAYTRRMKREPRHWPVPREAGMTQTIKPGDLIRDNDPRMWGRVLTVAEVSRTWVYAKDSMDRMFRYSRERVYTDDKRRRTGFSLVRFA